MNVYDAINSRILELLEQGTVPWRKTWNSGSIPKNIVSKKEYRGVNVFLLSCMPYSSRYWMTFKQCQEKGGHIIKGSKSTPVIFWKWLEPKDTDSADADKTPMLRFYNVFNLSQTEGIEPPQTTETVNTFTPIEQAEQIIANMPQRPEVKHRGNQPYYSPKLDYIQINSPTTFNTPEDYYDTFFHELIHSTGHESRLARKGIMETSYYGSHAYSKEELVAECGAAFLCGHVGIEQKTVENNAAYIQGFLKLLKGDKTALVHAAALAQKASDFVLNIQHEQEEVS